MPLPSTLPSPAPPSPPVATSKLDLDINGLQKILQQIDESFHASDDDVDRRLRLQHLERQQVALQQLCDAALQQQDGQAVPPALDNSTDVRPITYKVLDTDVVSTPRSIDAFNPSHNTRETLQSIARKTETCLRSPHAPLVAPPRLLSPSRVTSMPHMGAGTTAQGEVKTPDHAGVATAKIFPLRSPELPPTYHDGAAVQEDRDLVESFLGDGRAKAQHPYAVEEGGVHRVRGSTGGWQQRGIHTLRGVRSCRLMAPRMSSGTDRTASPEHFDIGEDEKLIRQLIGRNETRVKGSTNRNNHCFQTAPTKGENVAAHSCGTEGQIHRHSTVPSASGRQPAQGDAHPTSTSMAHNPHKEDCAARNGHWVRGKSVKELTQKMECLARHLVKCMRDRLQLQYRVDRLEGMLDVANTEVGRLRRTLEQREEGTLTESAWRATINAKERELRVCEDEIRRLRILVEQQVTRQGCGLARQNEAAALQQAKADLECMMQELGVAHMRRREMEEEFERTKQALDAAESHIQMLDKRLAQAERAAALARVWDVSGDLNVQVGDVPSAPASTALQKGLPEAKLKLQANVGNVDSWTHDAQREIARLTAHIENLALKHAESDRHAELRLSNARKESDVLRRQCNELRVEVRSHEVQIETLRRDRVAVGLREGQLRQQLLDLRDDAVLLADLLQATTKNAKGMLQILGTDDVEHRQSKAAVERFVAGVLCDFDALGRFFGALQCIDIGESRCQMEERVSVSEATAARRDFVLKAVEDAMERPSQGFGPATLSSSKPPCVETLQAAHESHRPSVAADCILATGTRPPEDRKPPTTSSTPSPAHPVLRWVADQNISLEGVTAPDEGNQPQNGAKMAESRASVMEGCTGRNLEQQSSNDFYALSGTNTDTEPKISLFPTTSWPSPQGARRGSPPSRLSDQAESHVLIQDSARSRISTGISFLSKAPDGSGTVASEGIPHLQQPLSHSMVSSQSHMVEETSDERSSGPMLSVVAATTRHVDTLSAQAVANRVDDVDLKGVTLELLRAEDRTSVKVHPAVSWNTGAENSAEKDGVGGEQTDLNDVPVTEVMRHLQPRDDSPENRKQTPPRLMPHYVVTHASSTATATREERSGAPVGRRPAVQQAADPAPLRRAVVGGGRDGRGRGRAVALAEPQRPTAARPGAALLPSVNDVGPEPRNNTVTATMVSGEAGTAHRHHLPVGTEFLSLRQPALANAQSKPKD
ncbi:hypothetical protein, conserved [Trypanosoma brucei brucei TREU927]|uniref:Bilobe protein, conserved n=1 Tax=Trypanosoma brucei brucei (strain 927/4 GUTat10.1) TaxID=185431 RepID=Q38BU4_TRYB2|nr:hypothetical protein, conserved [Trypanosoma brucei brucei TREU927]EAN77726.1 hypothetical protein, conserved [Trypanosoma brucei brucei TREU927]